MTIYVNIPVELEQDLQNLAKRRGCTSDQLASIAVARLLRENGEEIPSAECEFPSKIQS